MEEQWKEIEGYPNYKVSDHGRVKSLNYNRKGIEKIMCPQKRKDGYFHVGLYCNKKKSLILLHRIIGIAFIPNPNNYPVVKHKDDNRSNNVLSNLEWGTQQSNIQDMFDKGRKNHRGTNNPRSKLTEDQVLEIRNLYSTGNFMQKELGIKYGVSQKLISCIITNKNWKHLI